MIALLDANLLIALFDAAHVHHTKAHAWFSQNRALGWATCPLTENACVRITSQPSYPGRLSIAEISRRLHHATATADHYFWTDSISLVDPALFNHAITTSSRHLTDLYLLGLAVVNQGRLATFDHGIQLNPVPQATTGNLVKL